MDKKEIKDDKGIKGINGKCCVWISFISLIPLISLISLFPFSIYAFEIPPNDGFVTDTAGILLPNQEEELEETLQQFRLATTNEIAIVIVSSLDGEVIADVAVAIGRKWGIGTEENDNGIIMLVDYGGQEIFIATGYGLEGSVPDIVAKGIIEKDILPRFRQSEYFEGIQDGVLTLIGHIGGEYTAQRYEKSERGRFFSPFVFFIFFILFEWLLAILGRTKSWWLGGLLGSIGGIFLALVFGWWLSIPILAFSGFLLDFIVSRFYKGRGRTPWWAGGSWGPGGSGGRGGFGGFSGGSFGGGGAGGRW